MSLDEEEMLLRELVKMEPALAELNHEFQYQRCFETYQHLQCDPESYKLVELIDAQTFERTWYWCKKS